jgi:hypothetical protein
LAVGVEEIDSRCWTAVLLLLVALILRFSIFCTRIVLVIIAHLVTAGFLVAASEGREIYAKVDCCGERNGDEFTKLHIRRLVRI